MLERCAWSRSKLGKAPTGTFPGSGTWAMQCGHTKPDPVLRSIRPPWLGPLAVGVGAVGLGAQIGGALGGLPGAATGALSAM